MTARKIGPHLRRGPKPKPKQPKRSKGRPTVPLREHPDRYTLARFDVADTLKTDLQIGERKGAVMVHGLAILRQGKSVADMRKAGERLRTMAKRYRKPDDVDWRKAIGRAVVFTILTAAYPPTNAVELAAIGSQIMEDAASAGEAEWARRELLPLIGLKLPLGLVGSNLAVVIVYKGWATEIKQWIAELAAADDTQTGQPEIAGIFCPT